MDNKLDIAIMRNDAEIKRLKIRLLNTINSTKYILDATSERLKNNQEDRVNGLGVLQSIGLEVDVLCGSLTSAVKTRESLTSLRDDL